MPPLRQNKLPKIKRTFVARQKEKRIFEDAVLNIPDDSAIIRVFHGIGGQGKTALFNELYEKSDQKIEPSYTFLKRAKLDLNGKKYTDPDFMLIHIRNGFAQEGIDLPCFDLALALIWENKKGERPFPKLTNPWLGRASNIVHSVTKQGTSIGSTLASGVPVGSLVTNNPVFKTISHWLIEKPKEKYLKEKHPYLKKLFADDGSLKPLYELSNMLTWMLAQDLNHHLKSNPNHRFALFIDEYESLFDQRGAGRNLKDNPFDKMIQSLVTETNGLLTVFFSREPLPWQDDANWQEDLKGNQHRLTGLSEEAAKEFLDAVPIKDVHIQQIMIESSREDSDQNSDIYPLLLSVQVEHWRNLSAKNDVKPEYFQLTSKSFEERRKELITRLLAGYGEGLQNAIEKLSFAQRFDKQAFEFTVKQFNISLSVDYYDRLKSLSFIAQSEDGFINFHKSVAECIRQSVPTHQRLETLSQLFEHFWSRAKVSSHFELNDDKVKALFEAAYLKQQLALEKDPEEYFKWLSFHTEILQQAALYNAYENLWFEALQYGKKHLEQNNYYIFATLNNLGVIHKQIGNFDRSKLFYKEALEGFYNTSFYYSGLHLSLLNNYGMLLKDTKKYDEAKAKFEEALNLCEMIIDSFNFHNDNPCVFYRSKAEIIFNKGGLNQDLKNLDDAKKLFIDALDIFKGLEQTDCVKIAAVLNALGGIHQELKEYKEAISFYRKSLKIKKKVLGAKHPDIAISKNNLAGIYQNQKEYTQSMLHFNQALEIFLETLGKEHPYTLGTQNRLNFLIKEMEVEGV